MRRSLFYARTFQRQLQTASLQNSTTKKGVREMISDVTKQLTQEVNDLKDMLLRVLDEIQYQEPAVVLDKDIKEWHLKNRISS